MPVDLSPAPTSSSQSAIPQTTVDLELEVQVLGHEAAVVAIGEVTPMPQVPSLLG